MTKHEIEEALGVCCGNTTDMVEHIHRTLQILARRTNENNTLSDNDRWAETTRRLAEHLGGDLYGPMATVYLHYLDRLDLIEHGSGIAGSWLTARGHDVLEALNKTKPLDAIVESTS